MNMSFVKAIQTTTYNVQAYTCPCTSSLSDYFLAHERHMHMYMYKYTLFMKMTYLSLKVFCGRSPPRLCQAATEQFQAGLRGHNTLNLGWVWKLRQLIIRFSPPESRHWWPFGGRGGGNVAPPPNQRLVSHVDTRYGSGRRGQQVGEHCRL